MNRDFYELCFRQYREERQEANNHDQRAVVMLLALLLLGAISSYWVGTFGGAYIFSSVSTFMFYLCAAATYGLTFFSLMGLYLSAIPYRPPAMENLDHWQHVARQQGAPSAATPSDSSDSENPDNGFYDRICAMLVKAQCRNAQINAKRRHHLNMALFLAANAAIALAGQVFFTLLLYL